MPWLSFVDVAWAEEALGVHDRLFVLEDHAPVGALADLLRRALPGRAVEAFAVEGWPACGTPGEALRHHELDGRSLAVRILARLGARTGR
jgi:transketolase